MFWDAQTGFLCAVWDSNAGLRVALVPGGYGQRDLGLLDVALAPDIPATHQTDVLPAIPELCKILPV